MNLRIRKAMGRLPWRAGLRLLHTSRRFLGSRIETAIVNLVNPHHNRFLPANMDIRSFFARLDGRNIEYVVLRWFEDLPSLDARHDIDLLVADESVEAMVTELSLWPIGHPVDLYSETGVEGTGYVIDKCNRAEIPLFPCKLARAVLENRVRYRELCYIPSTEHHFWTLAYHATFLKGPNSGIRASELCDEPLSAATHDYQAALRALGARIGVELPEDVTRAGLTQLLATQGWLPSAAGNNALAAASSVGTAAESIVQGPPRSS